MGARLGRKGEEDRRNVIDINRRAGDESNNICDNYDRMIESEDLDVLLLILIFIHGIFILWAMMML